MGLLRNLFHRKRIEEQLDAELNAYVDLLARQLEQSGLGPAEARRAALVEAGGIESVKEQCRDARSGEKLIELWRDVRYAVRSLSRSPGFTTVAVLSLALGVGANAVIFGMFYAAFVRPLPYPQADRLFAINRIGMGVMTPELILWRAGARSLDAVTGWDNLSVTMTGQSSPENLDAALAPANFLSVLRVRPRWGRGITEEDGRPGAAPSAILCYEFWQRKFGGDASVAGRTVALDGKPTTILGIMGPEFRFPGNYRPDLLMVDRLPAKPDWAMDTAESFNVIGRLREGFTPPQAADDLAALSAGPEVAQFVKNFGGTGSHIALLPLQATINGRSRPVFGMLLAAVSLLLLIAGTNVANLQLGRTSVRAREICLRAALGASRWRLARLAVIENLVLSACAGAAGMLLAWLLLNGLRSIDGLPVVGWKELEPGWVLFAAALGLSAAAGLAIGLAPALLGSRVELSQAIKSGSLATMGSQKSRLRPALVVTQVALALVLLVGSGLLLRSLQDVMAIPAGFRPASLLTARLQLPAARYGSDAQQRAFVEQLLERVSGLPGVQSAAAGNTVPLTNYSIGTTVRREGDPVPARGSKMKSSAVMIVTPQYFRTLGMRLLRGRLFDGHETEGQPLVAIVNAHFARTFFGTEDVAGRQIQFQGLSDQKPWWTILGVVNDVHTQGPEAEIQSEIFVPEGQQVSRRVHVLIRTAADPLALAKALREAVSSLDPELPLTGLTSMEGMLSQRGAGRRAETWLLSAFAFLALCLAGIGIYGVVSEAVSRRTREIGLRIALGARTGDVMRMVMRRSLLLALAGVAAGSAAGLYLVRYLSSQLFGVRPGDPATFCGAALVLLAVAAIAGYLPARRAVGIDPVESLRCD